MIRSLASLLAIAFATAAYAADVPKDTRNFIDTVASANKFEIDSSELAQQHAKSPDVKAFAEKMVADHKQAGSDFKSALQKAEIPAPNDAMGVADTAKYAKLRVFTTESGFDKAYIDAQVKAHQDAVGLFKGYSINGPTPEMKSFAMKTLPTLEQHLKDVQTLQGKVARN